VDATVVENSSRNLVVAGSKCRARGDPFSFRNSWSLPTHERRSESDSTLSGAGSFAVCCEKLDMSIVVDPCNETRSAGVRGRK